HKVSYWRFFAMDGLAACLSVPVWVYLGYYGAENINWLLEKVHQFQHIMIILTVIAAVVLAYYFYRHHRRTRFFRESRPKILERRKHLEISLNWLEKKKNAVITENIVVKLQNNNRRHAVDSIDNTARRANELVF
ncbi:MAG: hypothetical protein IJ881_03430, partial [Neisseriaceae bacterium]|nr:hypothetical protein [Neisseriaceae bacterium]